MRGLSAAYWLLKTNPWMKAGDTILLHAAAGGVGLIAVQWAKLLGLRVIGTVSTEEKAELAKAHGCDEIIYYRREDVADRVRQLTDGVGVTTVFDTVGKDTFEGSLKSLKRRGVLVGCGTASGPFPPIDALQLAIQGSVTSEAPATSTTETAASTSASARSRCQGRVALATPRAARRNLSTAPP